MAAVDGIIVNDGAAVDDDDVVAVGRVLISDLL